MTHRHSDTSITKTDRDTAQARQRVTDTLLTVAAQLPDTGLARGLLGQAPALFETLIFSPPRDPPPQSPCP